MSALTVMIDKSTEAGLQQMAQQRHISTAEVASRLLRRAVRAAQPKVVYDVEALKAYERERRSEELALADSDSAHRLKFLEMKDRS